MCRSAYYPVEYLELGDSWSTLDKPSATKSASKDSAESTVPTPTRHEAHSAVPATPTRPMVIPQAIKVSHDNEQGFEMGHAGEEF